MDDQTELFELIRGRVLERTREALGMSREEASHAPRFASAGKVDVRAFVGRMLSEQNLLVARGSGGGAGNSGRPDPGRAVAQGIEKGLGDCFERWDPDSHEGAEAWELFTRVLAEFQRKVVFAASPRS